MFFRFRWMIITAICLVAVVCIIFGIARSEAPIVSSSHASVSIPELPNFVEPVRGIETSSFIDEGRANGVWVNASRNAKAVKGTVIAGIVNHHTLAANLIADFFANLRASRPDLQRIVIVSPDHFKAGRDEVSTHIRPYQVGTMNVNVDEDAVRHLIDAGVATEEDGMLFEREHGIGALVPFIARAYPNMKIVPIAFRGDLSKSRSQRLSEALKELWDEKTVIVISADMSHYLKKDQSLKNDEVTFRLLETKDVAIASSTDAYIDSGKSVSTLFVTMNELYPHTKFIRFNHSISSDYGADPNNATSYMTGVWELDDFLNTP